jgi:hypothetical protein
MAVSCCVAGLLQMEWQLSKFMAELEDDHRAWSSLLEPILSVGFWPRFTSLIMNIISWLARSIHLQQISEKHQLPKISDVLSAGEARQCRVGDLGFGQGAGANGSRGDTGDVCCLPSKHYHLVMTNIAMERSSGKPSINCHFPWLC